MKKLHVLQIAALMVVMLGLTGCLLFFLDNSIDTVKFFVDGEEFTEELLELQPGDEVNITIEVLTGRGQKMTNCIVSWTIEHTQGRIFGDLDRTDRYEVVFTAVEDVQETVHGALEVTAESPMDGEVVSGRLRIKVEPQNL